MARWDLWIDNQYGERMANLAQVKQFSVSKIANSPGGFSLTIPAPVPRNWLMPDNIIEFWRQSPGHNKRLFNLGFLLQWIHHQDENDLDVVTLIGQDPLCLLDRRIVGYGSETSEGSKSDYADDAIKEIVDENLGSSAASGRDISLMMADSGTAVSAGKTVSKEVSYRPVGTAAREIAANSGGQGTDVFFDFIPTFTDAGKITLTFETFINQPGRDRTGDYRVVFGPEFGNMANPELEYDYSATYNVVYGGGRNLKGTRRNVQTITDDTRRVSPWGRSEAFFSGCMADPNTAEASGTAYEEIHQARPTALFSGELKDVSPTVYDVDWAWGDKVAVSYQGRQEEGIVRVVTFDVDSNGIETLNARMEIELND